MRKLIGTLPSAGPNPASRLFVRDGCACAGLGERAKLGLGWDLFGGLALYGFVSLRSRTPWLELVRCTRCGRYWYLASDTVEADALMQRLSGEQVDRIIERNDWPVTFDEMPNVWPEGQMPKRPSRLRQ
jgi:hypothetical protein